MNRDEFKELIYNLSSKYYIKYYIDEQNIGYIYAIYSNGNAINLLELENTNLFIKTRTYDGKIKYSINLK